MQTRPTHIPPQTIKQAKAAYRKYGARLSEREVGQLERAAELQRRADAIKEAEKRRKANQKRKAEKEQREKEARRRMNIASQKEYVGPSQIRLDCFVKVDDDRKGTRGERGALEGDDEPWEVENINDEVFLNVLDSRQAQSPKSRHPEETGRQSAGCRLEIANDESVTRQPVNNLDLSFDEWDDFLSSNTQIEREITTDSVPLSSKPVQFLLPPLSTQDLSLDDKDMEELGLKGRQQAEFKKAGSLLMPPPSFIPVRKPRQPRFVGKAISFSPEDFILSTQDMRDITS